MKPIEYEGKKDKVYSGSGVGETMGEIMNRRYSRRGIVASAAATGAVVITAGAVAAQATPEASPVASPIASPVAGGVGFESLTLQTGETPVVPDGYTVVPFLRWGDPLFADSPAFDAHAQTAAAQAL